MNAKRKITVQIDEELLAMVDRYCTTWYRRRGRVIECIVAELFGTQKTLVTGEVNAFINHDMTTARVPDSLVRELFAGISDSQLRELSRQREIPDDSDGGRVLAFPGVGM